MQTHIYEGWRVIDFIEDLEPLVAQVMDGKSYINPIKTKKEMREFLKDNQPYYKKSIPKVNNYFIKKYNLK